MSLLAELAQLSMEGPPVAGASCEALPCLARDCAGLSFPFLPMSGIDISNHSMQPCLVVAEASCQALWLKPLPLQALQVLPLQALGLEPLQAVLQPFQAFFCSSVWELPA